MPKVIEDNIVWLDADGVVHIRNSERGTLNKCPQRWWWAWREGLQPKETSKALWFGSAIHAALADYYQPGTKRSKDYIDVFREFADMEAEYVRTNVGDIDEEKWVDARTLGEQMLIGYHKHYGGDRKWRVIAPEQSFEVAIPIPRHSNPFVRRVLKPYGDYFLLNGTFDLVYYDMKDKRIKLGEHKTAASIWEPYAMDNQTGSYWMVAGTVGKEQGWLGKNDQIREITYNFLRKALPDDRPRDAKGHVTNKPTKEHYIEALDDYVVWDETSTGRVKYPTIAVMEEMAAEHGLVVLGDRSKRQPPPLFDRKPMRMTVAHKRTQLARIQAEFVRMVLIVEGVEDLLKHSSRDTCPMCPFKEMCELHETGGGWVEFRDAMFRATDPYADHRKSA